MESKSGKKSSALILAFSMFAITCLTVSPLYAGGVPGEVMTAAENGFKALLQKIPVDGLAHFNFSNLEEIEESVLGEPFRIHTILPEIILTYGGGVPLEKMISQTPIWIFPVLAGGEVRTFITVDLVEGAYQTVSVGGSALAKEWASVIKQWPPSAGYEHTFVRVYQATSDFILLSHGAQGGGMVALSSARVSLGLSAGQVYNPAQILPALQAPVRKNLQSSGSLNK